MADINIVGSADLVEQTFDYEFVVRPGVSKTLPVIGAIAGGPVGAAAGLALQAILRDALGEAAEARYTIGGTWEDPVVEPVERPPAKSIEEGSGSDEPVPEQPEIIQEPESGATGQQTTDENSND